MELAITLPNTSWVYVADRECDIHEFMARARRQPQMDWLIRAAQNRKLAEGDTLWVRLAASAGCGRGDLHPPSPAEPTQPTGDAHGAGRIGDGAAQGRPTGSGDRAAGA